VNIDLLLSKGSIEGPFKRTRPARHGAIGRAVRALLGIVKGEGKLL
jgi:hypothetical protein